MVKFAHLETIEDPFRNYFELKYRLFQHILNGMGFFGNVRGYKGSIFNYETAGGGAKPDDKRFDDFVIRSLYQPAVKSGMTEPELDVVRKKPIDGATVSINNSTIGTSTGADGAFMLPKVKAGQYDLIISCLGYGLYYQKLIVNNTGVNLPVIEMTVQSIQLREVKISPNRPLYLSMFTRAFLGNTVNAQQCK
jgi:hypothetical protein